MREVAALAGVSLKTVSRAINREPGVSPDLLDHVEDANSPSKLPPQRHGQQSAERDRRTATIGLMLDDVSNPFSWAMNRALEDVARQRETLVFAGGSDGNAQREAQFVRALSARQVNGLIVMPVGVDHGCASGSSACRRFSSTG